MGYSCYRNAKICSIDATCSQLWIIIEHKLPHFASLHMAYKLSHYTPVGWWVRNPVINALNTTLQCAARIALRQKKKTATLDRNTHDTTGILPFRMYTQYKCFFRVNLFLFMDKSEPYLPSLITESDSQHATSSACSYKF